jgi:hypothetical protein
METRHGRSGPGNVNPERSNFLAPGVNVGKTKGKSEALKQIDAVIGKSGGKKKGSKGRKIGRYSKHLSSVRYRSERRWETNQVKRVRRHLKRQPSDTQARSWFADFGGRDAQAFLAGLEKVA